jgi:hypothetical protein
MHVEAELKPSPGLNEATGSKKEWPAGVGPGVGHTEEKALTARGRDSPTETHSSGQ